MFEIFIVFGGLLYYLIINVYQISRDSVKRSRERNASHYLLTKSQLNEALTNRELEKETWELIKKNWFANPDSVYELIEDNLRRVYGDDYKTKFKLSPTSVYNPYATSNSRWALALILSKHGYLPSTEIEFGFTSNIPLLSEIQGNLLSTGTNVTIVCPYNEFSYGYIKKTKMSYQLDSQILKKDYFRVPVSIGQANCVAKNKFTIVDGK